MRTLILNMTRFGDVLQTQPVVSGLKAAGREVGLVCLDNFAPAAKLLQGLSYVKPLPGSRLLALLDQDWRAALRELQSFVREIDQAFPAQALLNLTATTGIKLLTRLVAQTSDQDPELLGFFLDRDGFGSNPDPWARFLLASTRHRGCSPFNLVDLFWKAARLGQGPRPFALRPPDPDEAAAALRLLTGESLWRPGSSPRPDMKARKGFTALQLGASEERRRWPLAHYAALGRTLWEELSLVPVLLGSSAEAGLGERYEALGAPCVNCIGKTSLTELAAVLTQTEALISNDTGTMHLAAGLGLPVAAIFLATAQPWDTGPYRGGNLCLEPDLDCHPCAYGVPCPRGEICRRAIAPDTVFTAVRDLLRTSPGRWLSGDYPGARAWETLVEEDNFMGLVSLSGHENAWRTQWVRLQRHVYRHFLDQTPLPREPLTLSDLDPAKAKAALDEIEEALQLLTLLGEQARALSLAPREALKRKFLAMWQRLQTLWDQSPNFNVLGFLWLAESQESGQDMASIQALLQRYTRLALTWQDILRPASP